MQFTITDDSATPDSILTVERSGDVIQSITIEDRAAPVNERVWKLSFQGDLVVTPISDDHSYYGDPVVIQRTGTRIT